MKLKLNREGSCGVCVCVEKDQDGDVLCHFVFVKHLSLYALSRCSLNKNQEISV